MPDFLKLDIDGMDGDVLAAVLRGASAHWRCRWRSTQNSPPYAFNVIASEHLRPGGATGFFGMSLQYACDLIKPFGYTLVGLDFDTEYTHDALFVREELSTAFPAWSRSSRGRLLSAPEVLPHILGADLARKQSWRRRTDRHVVLQEIWEAMLDAGERKHGHTRAPFTLYLSS